MFKSGLKASLEVKIDGTTVTVEAGNIKYFKVHHHYHGFSAEVVWWKVRFTQSAQDTLYAKFVSEDLIEAKLTIDRLFDAVGEETDSIVLKGLVTTKTLRERAFSDLSGQPVLHRRYSIKFADRAAVLWKQHYPTELYVEKSIKELIEAHKPTGMTITWSWPEGNSIKYPVLFLGLGEAHNKASFYDFFVWVLKRYNVDFFYDATADSYTISTTKKTQTAVIEIPPEDIDYVEEQFPETIRHSGTVYNSYSVDSKTTQVANAQADTKIKKQFLMTSSVTKDFNDRVTLETSRLKVRKSSVFLNYARYASVTIKPSGLIKLLDGWSTNIHQNQKQYRITSIHLSCTAELQNATDSVDEESNTYDGELTVEAEQQGEELLNYPEFITPQWPSYVQGVVVSEEGTDTEITYQAYTNSTTSIDYYKVKVPLWNNQNVVAIYEPGMMPGHFYFPGYKNERVLLRLEFQRAFISRFIDWRTGARLPKETQGNHLLLGKLDKDNTSVKHVYESNQPVFSIIRTNDKDLQTMKVSEGTILLKTEETPE